MLVLLAWGTADMLVYQPRLRPLMSSDAANESAGMLAAAYLMIDVFPEFFTVE